MTIEEWGLELDGMLPAVTPEAVMQALKGDKRLSLTQGRDWDWLAMSVRRALAIAQRYGADHPDEPERASDKQVRDKLRAVAEAASPLAQLLASLSHCRQTVGMVQEYGDAAHDRLTAAASEVAWVMHFAERAAKAIEVPRKQLLSPERKEMRIDWARHLAPVFEIAFGQRVTAANNTVTTNDLARIQLSPFQFFYLNMAEVAFGSAGRADTDIVGVTKAARTKHRRQPVIFAAGIITGI
jgi:hypothetical protein